MRGERTACYARFMGLFRSKVATVGSGFYLLISAAAIAYPLFSKYKFSGLLAVVVTLPWSDYLPTGASGGWLGLLLAGCAVLNALIIYAALWVLSRGVAAATAGRRTSN
jgi:hypothetical protein